MSSNVVIVNEDNEANQHSDKNTLQPSMSSQSSSSLRVPPPQGLFPLANSAQVANSGSRQKVSLRPGFSLMDWIRLCKSAVDLAGTGGKLRSVTMDELKRHRRRDDAWMAINGKVFNVSAYMDYHPGGWDELMKGAGKDATNLFNEVHRWVNYESMLEACLVGKLCDEHKPIKAKTSANSLMAPPKFPLIPPIGSSQQRPKIDSYQTSSTFVVAIYTKALGLRRECVLVDLVDGRRLGILVYNYNDGIVVAIKCKLENEASLSNVRVHEASGKVELHLTKSPSSPRWRTLSTNDFEMDVQKLSKSEFFFVDYKLSQRKTVTHDVDHLVLKPPKNFFMRVPIGHHVKLKANVTPDMSIIRNYTPVPSDIINEGDEDSELIHLLIKTYSSGALTPVLKQLKEGDTVKVSNHDGVFHPDLVANFDYCLMLAAGTGFTPMAKVLRSLRSSFKRTTLVFFNKKERDIMWRSQLEGLRNVIVHHVLSDDPKWTGKSGRIDGDLVDELISEYEERKKIVVLVCGPNQFSATAERLLKSSGLEQEQIVIFKG